jgi:hypothetical protein
MNKYRIVLAVMILAVVVVAVSLLKMRSRPSDSKLGPANPSVELTSRPINFMNYVGSAPVILEGGADPQLQNAIERGIASAQKNDKDENEIAAKLAGNGNAAVPILSRLLKGGNLPGPQRSVICRTLALIGTPASLYALVSHSVEEPRDKPFALAALSNVRDSCSASGLVLCMAVASNVNNGDLLTTLKESLIKIRPVKPMALISPLAKDARSSEQVGIVGECIQALGSAEELPVLVGFASNARHPTIAKAAAYTIANCPKGAAIEALAGIEPMKNSDGTAWKKEDLLGMGFKNLPEPELLYLAKSTAPEDLRIRAIRVLITFPDAVPQLKALISSERSPKVISVLHQILPAGSR